jgi:TetR/AcrR family transcriptional regulator, cholesterol catabolism regulator
VTSDRLINVAMELFLAGGYHATSVQEIVDAAEVTKGAFYHHFDSKDDLLSLAHEEYLRSQLELLRRMRTGSGSVSERFSKLIGEILAGVVANRPRVSLFLEERRALSGDRFAAAIKLRYEYEAEMTGFIEDGMRSGAFSEDLDPTIAALGVFGMLSWTYQWIDLDDRPALADVIATFTKLIMSGLQPRPS